MDQRGLARVAARQRGFFTRADAYDCGLSERQVARRIAAGEWSRVIGSTLAAAGTEVTPELLDLAAQLSLPGSVLAGLSAARAWGMPVDDPRIMLMVGAADRRRLASVHILRTDPDRTDVGWRAGSRITWHQRTVFDCLRVLGAVPGLKLLDRALQQRWATIDGLLDLARANVGRRGMGPLRQLLAMARGGERSAGERRLTALLGEAGVGGWRANVEARDSRGLVGVGDVVFDRQRLIIEVDGLAFHVAPEAFQRDRVRQNRLVNAGWTVLRFTWRDLTERPDYVLGTIRRTLVRVA